MHLRRLLACSSGQKHPFPPNVHLAEEACGVWGALLGSSVTGRAGPSHALPHSAGLAFAAVSHLCAHLTNTCWVPVPRVLGFLLRAWDMVTGPRPHGDHSPVQGVEKHSH